MAVPDVKVYIGFGSNLNDEPQTWTEVSSTVMNLSIRRGRQYEMNRIEAGTAIIQLKNTDGYYWSTNTSSPYYPNVRPMVMLKVETVWSGTTYPLYCGYVESWEPDFIQKPITAPVMVVSCVDKTKSLNRFLINNAGYSAELSGTRVNNILTAFGWSTTTRSIDTGQSNVISTGALVNENALEHLYDVQDAEDGIFLVSPSGGAVFQDRHYRLASTAPLATFSDTSTNRYASVDLIRDDSLIYNQARLTRVGGTEQVYGTATTTEALRDGLRVWEKSGLLNTNDTECYIKSMFTVAKYKDSALRARAITIIPEADQSNLYSKVFDYDISDKIAVSLSQATLSADYYIEGIEQDWDVQTQIWRTTWQLSNADWNAPTLSAIDTRLDPTSNVSVQFIPSAGTNWQCVSDSTDATYVYKTDDVTTGDFTDKYGLSDLGWSNTVINSVTVWTKSARYGVGSTSYYVQAVLRVNSTDYYGAQKTAGLNSDVWATNPNTSTGWVYADINDLIAGVLFHKISFVGLEVYEEYVIVNQTPTW